MRKPKYTISHPVLLGDIVLASHCDLCDGQGRIPNDILLGKPPVCPHCGGVGATLEDAGAQILVLVKDFLLKDNP